MTDLPATPPAIEARIDAQATDGRVQLTGVLAAGKDFSGRYDLAATKDGPSGHSTVRQGGAAQASAGQTVGLSNISLGALGPDDRWSAVLRLYQGQTVVAEVARDSGKK